MTSAPQLTATGTRVRVATVTAEDIEPYRRAVELSRERLSQWNPVDPDDLRRHLAVQSSMHRTFVIRALDAEGSHGIVGKVNVSNVVRGRFQNATIGYDAYAPYAGRGLFGEGLRLVVDLAFTPEPRGMGLHRLEANVQLGNAASQGSLRSLGFRREGTVRDMLWLADASGATAWRDHGSHAVTAGEWPAQSYQPHQPERLVVVVNGPSGAGRTTLARALSRELGIPLLSPDSVVATTDRPLPSDVVWRLLADSPTGGVVDGSFAAGQEAALADGLLVAGAAPAGVPHVLWDSPDAAVVAPAQVGESIRVDGSRRWGPHEVTRLALQVRAVTVLSQRR